MCDAKYNGRLEEGGIGFGQLKKVMVAKRVSSACARVTNLLEVLWDCVVCQVKATSAKINGNACGTAETPDSG